MTSVFNPKVILMTFQLDAKSQVHSTQWPGLKRIEPHNLDIIHPCQNSQFLYIHNYYVQCMHEFKFLNRICVKNFHVIDNKITSNVANMSPTHFRGPPPNGK